ncbi:MAG: DUF6159 family protein [Dehalococcoidia bacterium]|nr:hypothetical protein [Chloroflexota bacterium]OUW96419.1 MAG: hypothetical protein CBD90_00645 [Chloroflexi bacterium TMED230]RZP13319.1 MAG: hypothetical protein EVA32_04305 [Chloroflexota bacterium]
MVNGGFFGNISNTIQLMKSCVNILKKDKELILFPIMAAIFVIALLGLIYSTGSIDLSAANEEEMSIFPIAILIFGANFIIVFFNSALISAALERLRGGDPNISSGISHALKHIHHIFLWSIIVTIMSLIFAAIKANGRNRGGIGGIMTQIFASFLEAGWAMMTFFVVPIIVSENLSPISAIKRSSSLFKQTWGNQVAANFGFGIFQIIAVLISLGIGWFFGLLNGTLGIAVGLLCATTSISIIYTLEGIYKAALYEHALGEKPLEFEEQDLRTAYRASSAPA